MHLRTSWHLMTESKYEEYCSYCILQKEACNGINKYASMQILKCSDDGVTVWIQFLSMVFLVTLFGFVSRKRRGAINAKQLAYLEKYRPKSRLKLKNGHKNACCLQ